MTDVLRCIYFLGLLLVVWWFADLFSVFWCILGVVADLLLWYAMLIV